MIGCQYYNICRCPTTIMSVLGLTLAQLTHCMEQKQPEEWTDSRGYCGDAAFSCTEPVCIPLPR